MENSDIISQPPEARKTKISVRNLNFYYGAHQALFDNNITFLRNR